MLFFIDDIESINFAGYIFKYISCYSLSCGCQVVTIRRLDLNTSHVILYHCLDFSGRPDCAFKYISCYSLSGMVLPVDPQGNLFKYISCYSLSEKSFWTMLDLYYLNTSHVILYLDAKIIKIFFFS